MLFFPDAALKPNKCFWLTDSSGQPLPHFGPNTDLRTYLRTATPQLSKLRVYVVYSPSEEVRFYILTCQLQMLPLTHFCSLCKVPDDKDEQPLPNEPEKTEEVEESIEYEGII